LSFSPLYGFDLNTDTINKFIASTSMAVGKIVVGTSTNNLALADDYGYFTLEEVTGDGPSYEERIAGLKQWEVIVGSCIPVLIPANGKIVRTTNVSSVTGNPTRGQVCNISDGNYCTASGAGAASVRGIIVGGSAETGIAGVYDVKIVNCNSVV
jgi:hypothetical protein